MGEMVAGGAARPGLLGFCSKFCLSLTGSDADSARGQLGASLPERQGGASRVTNR